MMGAMCVTEAELGWLAGLIDGEGSIAIFHYSNHGFYSVMKVAMTHRETIEHAADLVCRITGGTRLSVFPHKVQDALRHKPQWFLEVKHRGRVEAVAREILPHSITKHANLALVIEWAEFREKVGPLHRFHPSLDDAYEFCRRSAELNRKGPSVVVG